MDERIRITIDKTEYLDATEFRQISTSRRRQVTGTSVKETEILRQIRDFLRLHGWMVIRNHQSLGSHPGVPDLVAVRGGQTVWIEVKRPTGRLSKAQEKFLQDLEDHGGWYIVARSVEDVEHLARR